MVGVIFLGALISSFCFGHGELVRGDAAWSQEVKVVEASVQEAKRIQQSGDFLKAVEILEKALGESKKSSYGRLRLDCLLSQADLYWLLGKVDEATASWKDACVVALKVGENKIREKCETALDIVRKYQEGLKLKSAGKLDEARLRFEEAVRRARKISSDPLALKSLIQVSLVNWEKNDYLNFLSMSEKALTFAQNLNSIRDQAKCLNCIGVYHYKKSDYSKAMRYFEDSLAKIQKKGLDINLESDCLNNIGICYRLIGNNEKALDYLFKAIRIYKSQGDKRAMSECFSNIGITLRDKGMTLNRKKDILEALEYLLRSRELAKEIKSKKPEIAVLNNIGVLFKDLRELDRSESYYKEVLKLAFENNEFELIGRNYSDLGNISVLKGAEKEAVQCFTKSIAFALKADVEDFLWEAYFGLGQCYEKQNNFPLARLFYQKAVAAVDKARNHIFLDENKAGFVRDKQKVFEALINLFSSDKDLSSSPNKNEELFFFVEKAKARAFLEALAEAPLDINENVRPEWREQEKQISRKLARAMFELSDPAVGAEKQRTVLEQMGRLEDEYMNVISKMRSEYPQKEPLVSPDICRLPQVQENLLDEKTAVMEYFLGENRSLAFYITKRSFEWRVLPPKKDIENSLKAYIKYLSSPSLRNIHVFPAAQRIFKELLFPLRGKKIEEIDRLIVIPDGILYFLPFETLIPPGLKDPSERDYLVNRAAISYAPSCSALDFLLKRKNGPFKPKGLLAFGKPVNSPRFSKKASNADGPGNAIREVYLNQGFEFSPLPHAKREVLSIARFFKGAKKDVFLGKGAREENIKTLPLRDYRIVHFACHGLLDEQFPSRSALVLSVNDEAEEDGFLQVREIYNLRLNADLVVLSACQTGKGRMENGEGVMGLPRIFFYTGAKSVVSTLWKISDRSTSFFMERFYRHLAEGEEKTEALRRAKLDMLKTRYSHPFHWAAFVLNGDFGEKIKFN